MIEIVVHGKPATQGSKRIGRAGGRGGRGGRPILIEDNDAAKDAWRETVRASARQALQHHSGTWPLDGPLAVAVVYTLRKPGNVPARKRIDGVLVPYVAYPATRPDVDKLERAVLDALKDAGVYADDGQVVTLVATKSYPGEWPWSLPVPGATILVRRHDALMADLLSAFAAGRNDPPAATRVSGGHR